MQRRDFLKLSGSALALSAGSPVRGVLSEERSCYMPGDTVDPGTFVLDAEQKTVKLLDIVKPETRVVVLVLFGGAYLTTTDKHGGIWCEDSLDEFANLKAVYNGWKDRGVQFVAVACPPVYSDRYGFEAGVFIEEPAESAKHREAVTKFIERTEALRLDRTVPFDQVYYDPRFRLLWNSRERAATPAYGPVHPWQGRLKWHRDEQRYGTPSIWFLDARGKVLREPLYGNNYSAIPPKILFTYWELEGAIGESLSKTG